MKTEWKDNEHEESLTLKAYLERVKTSPTLKPYQKAVLTLTASAWSRRQRTDHLNADPTEA